VQLIEEYRGCSKSNAAECNRSGRYGCIELETTVRLPTWLAWVGCKKEKSRPKAALNRKIV